MSELSEKIARAIKDGAFFRNGDDTCWGFDSDKAAAIIDRYLPAQPAAPSGDAMTDKFRQTMKNAQPATPVDAEQRAREILAQTHEWLASEDTDSTLCLTAEDKHKLIQRIAAALPAPDSER